MARPKLPTIRRAGRLAGGLAACCALLLTAANAAAQDDPRPQLALMGTVPLYWGEVDGLPDLLNAPGSGHWARPVLERHFQLAPLDYLSTEALAPYRVLLMAQPRGLSAEENVALDGWVRGGGRLLLFADPMMTGESLFPIGDRRRPQDVVLLSPILAHWGLDLRFDEDQEAGLRFLQFNGSQMPVNLPGTFFAAEGTNCEIGHDNIVGLCAIGAGVVLLVADAAFLDLAGPYPGAEETLSRMASITARGLGETTGNVPTVGEGHAESPPIPVDSDHNDRPVDGSPPT